MNNHIKRSILYLPVFLLYSCVSVQSPQVDYVKSLFKTKDKEKSWYVYLKKERIKLTPLFLKNSHITFYGDNNIQIDFNGWFLNEIRLLNNNVKIWKKMEEGSKHKIIINNEINEELICQPFQKTEKGYKRICLQNDTQIKESIIKNQTEIIEMNYFLSYQFGYIKLKYE